MEKNQKDGRTQGSFQERFSDLEEESLLDLDICSATDCTGLIPALPQSGSEITSYEELYHFLPRAKD